MKTCLGPFFTGSQTDENSNQNRAALPQEITPLGISIEWASPAKATHIALLRFHPPYTGKLRLWHIMVDAAELPCDVTCPESQVIESGGMKFVPMEYLLLALYRTSEVQRPIRDTLRELLTMVPVDVSVLRPAPAHGLLLPMVEAEGFGILTACSQEEGIYLDLGWRPSESASLIHVAVCRFKNPKDPGEWVQPQGPIGIAQLLADDFRQRFPSPLSLLLTQAGHDYLRTLSER